MLGNQEQHKKTIFLNIKDGKITRRNGLFFDEFDFVSGKLEQIRKVERTFNGETFLYWYMILRGRNNERYSLGFGYNSGVFKSIILCLASDKTLSPLSEIKIETYLKEDKTKVSVYDGETRLSWITKDLPKVEILESGGKKIRNDSERMKYICNLVTDIRFKIGDIRYD